MTNFHSSVQNLKQSFINNGYANHKFDAIFQKYLMNLTAPISFPPNTTDHVVYYQNQFSKNYKVDERVMKDLVNTNVKCTDHRDNLKLVIYYKPSRVSALITKNNQSPPLPVLKRTNLVYEYTCKDGGCERQHKSYIGMTSTTLSRRLTMHKQNGSIRNHSYDDHDTVLTRQILDSRTKIVRLKHDLRRLIIFEALIILAKNPALNIQTSEMRRILQLFE